MRVLIQIPDNPNCDAVDGLVFAPRTSPRIVEQVRLERDGKTDWYAVTGLDDPGVTCPATAALIDDSEDGAATWWLAAPWDCG